MAMAIPDRDMMLDVSPEAYIGMKEMITAIGMVTIGIAALGRCRRNNRITKLTMINSSPSVWISVSMERWIRSERS